MEQPFDDEDWVLLAATHRSWTRIVVVEKEERENIEAWVGPPVCNGRLAAVGLTSIQAALTAYLFVRYPNVDGPTIKKVTAYLSGNDILTRAALNVGYQHLLRCREVAVSNPTHPDSERIIGESFCGLVGAVLAEQGVGAANNFALDMLVPLLEGVDLTTFTNIHVDPKQYLFSLLHREGGSSPTYTILKETGRQSHAPMFLVGVFSGDEKLAEGASYSLKDAKREAAKAALRMRYSQELGPNTELPESWGDYSLEDTKEYIGEKDE